MNDSNKPDFLIVGAAKSGTTALWHWLKQNTGVYVPAVKEPHYFCFADGNVPYLGNELDPFYRSSLVTHAAAYSALWQDARPGQIKGEASPGYLYYPASVARIVAMNPRCKIIALFREPAERAFSQFMHHVRDGYEPMRSFEDALTAEAERSAKGWWWAYRYRDAGHYGPQWQHYQQAFPQEQLLALLYDDLRDRPEETYRQVCAFLGVNAGRADFATRHNNTESLTQVPNAGALSRLLRHGSTISSMARQVLPQQITSDLKSKLQSLNSHKAPELKAETAAELRRHFADDVQQLSQMIGRDLGHWA